LKGMARTQDQFARSVTYAPVMVSASLTRRACPEGGPEERHGGERDVTSSFPSQCKYFTLSALQDVLEPSDRNSAYAQRWIVTHLHRGLGIFGKVENVFVRRLSALM
jgi:hypothetical protein